MLGTTSIGKIFSITHCSMHRGVEDNYRQALLKLKMLYSPHDIPNVFVKDKESARINVIHSVFPETKRMLCKFHISKCVQQHCKLKFNNESIQEEFFQSCSNLTQVTLETKFFKGQAEFLKDWASFPKCVGYLSKT